MGKRSSFNLDTSDVKVEVKNGTAIELNSYKHDQDAVAKTTEEQEEKRPRVSLRGLYRFADGWDKLGIFAGVVIGIIQAGIMQSSPVILGESINRYVDIFRSHNNTTNGTNSSFEIYDDNMDDQIKEEITELSIDIAIIMSILTTLNILAALTHISLFSLIGDRQARRVRRLAFHNVLRQDIAYFDKHMGGELNTRLAEDTVRYQNGIGDKMGFTNHWIWVFFFALIYSFITAWQLTLVMLAMVPIAVIISGSVNQLVKRVSKAEAEEFAIAGAVAEEAISSIRIVAAFAGEKKEVDRYNESLTRARKTGVKASLITAISQGISWMLIFIFAGVLVWYAGILVSDGEVDPGAIAQVMQCMISGTRALSWAVGSLEIISDAQGAAYGIFEIIDHKTDIDPMTEEGKKLDKIEGKITFEDVHFEYPARRGVKVLTGLSLTVQPGQTVALVGPSGCGKSTTIQLLQRYYNQQGGKVCVDGHDVRDLNVRWFRKQVGVVSQEPVLFATTVEDNIRFGNENCTQAEIIECATEANAHEFIMKLPQGYQTLLNEQSTQLSRGEKQRISLARALIRKPKILLLDECTSALDNESEQVVQAALEKASKGRTTIVIAHRLSTVRDSHCLFVVDKGVVAEYGTHQELLARKQLYHTLVSRQMTEASEKDEFAKGLEAEEMERRKHAKSFSVSMRSRSNASFMEDEEFDLEDIDDESGPLEPASYSSLLALNEDKTGYLIAGCFGGFLMGACWPLFSVFFGKVLDAFTWEDMDALRERSADISYALYILGGAAGIISISTNFLLKYAGEHLSQHIRVLSFTAMLRQEIGWFDRRNNQVGSLTSRLANDASRIKTATGAPLASLTNAFSAVVLSIVVSLLSGWQFGLLMVGLMPLQTLAGFIQSYGTNKFALSAAGSVEESGKIASEAVDKIRIVASLSKEDFFLDKYMGLFDALKKDGRKRAMMIGGSWGGFQGISGVIYTIALTVGFLFVAEGWIEFDAIFTILFCVMLSSLEVGRANAYVPEITAGRAAATKMFRLLERESKINPNDPTGITPDACQGEVSMTNTNFFYPTRTDLQALHNLNLSAARGQSIAMVGPSGGGKTTTIQLIERFYDATTGSVCIDGRSVETLNIQWLRSQMALVTQDPILFSFSLRENIAYGDNKREVPMDEIIEAAKAANIHDFISKLPLGYDTTVGSKGSQLSGGQKQRVSIARALIRNPKILLLDDATSALDTQSEAVVEKALDNARSGRTCIVVSHRLSSIVNADLILYVDGGKIIEKGTHAQLMAKEANYYKLQKANLGK